MDRIYLNINNQEYALTEKLVYAPEVDSSFMPVISDYDIRKTMDVLKILGFDLTENRIQGKEIVKTEVTPTGTVFITPTWTLLNEVEIATGKSSIRLKENQYIERNIKPWYGNPLYNIMRMHEWSRFNRSISKTHLGLPRDLNNKINRFNNKGIALNQHYLSRCVHFDIDNHEYVNQQEGRERADYSLNMLYKELGYPEEAMIETSFTGGYHVSFLTDAIVKDDDTRGFVKYINTKYNIGIEVRLTTKVFRLPNHFTYHTGYTRIIDDKVEFIPFDTTEAALSGWKDRVLSADAQNKRIPYSIISEAARPEGIKKSIYTRVRPVVSGLQPMTAGKRDKAMWRSACTMVRFGKTREEYLEYLYSANVSSRDWSSWDDSKRRAEAFRCWDAAVLKNSINGLITTPQSRFVSSIKQLPEDIKKLCSNPIIISYFNPDSESRYLKTRERSAFATKIMLSEIIGRAIYEEKNPRVASCGSQQLKGHLETGYQFPRKFMDLAGEHHGINASVRRISEHILNNTGIVTPYVWNGKSGRYSSTGSITFCRQWITSAGIVASFKAMALKLLNLYKHNTIQETTGHDSNMCEFCSVFNLEVTNKTAVRICSPPE